MNWYEQKQEEKRERIEAAAERARREADARYNRAREAVAGIPPGQPILVGHHSERHHRAALRRHDQNMSAAVEADKRASELQSRAASVGTGGISSDDPDAIDKLREKLAEMQRKREEMKKVNRLYKKRDADGLAAMGVDIARLDAEIQKLHSWDRQPFPSYSLQNLGANIRRVEARIATLERNAEIPSTEQTIGRITVRDDADENRIALEFPKELESFRAIVKATGFRWSPTRRAWVRKRGAGAMAYAVHLATTHEREAGTYTEPSRDDA